MPAFGLCWGDAPACPSRRQPVNRLLMGVCCSASRCPLQVLETLREDMGIEFEVYSSPAAQDTYSRHSTDSSGRKASAKQPKGSSSSSSSSGNGSSTARASRAGAGSGAKGAATGAASRNSGTGRVKRTGAGTSHEMYEYYEIGESDDEDDIVWASISVEEIEGGGWSAKASSSRGRRRGSR